MPVAAVLRVSVAGLVLATAAVSGHSGNCSSDLEDVSQLQRGALRRASTQALGDHEDEARCDEEMQVFPYGQAHLWGTGYAGWEQCAGKSQSPVNLGWTFSQGQSIKVTGGKLNISYLAVSDPPTLNNGHALKVKGDFMKLTLSGATYVSPQFHFHHPSEHTVHGSPAALEMHIPFMGEQGIAEIGILFNIGFKNQCLEKILREPPRAGCSRHVGPTDLHCFERQLSGPWWSYSGSLTTPPCTEGVKWHVMKRRATISSAQLRAFKTRFESNARPVQDLNGREVTFHWVGPWSS